MYTFNAKLQKEAFSDGDVMIHNTETQTVHILNPTSVAVLDLILEHETAEALSLFLSRFSGDPSEAQRKEMESDFLSTVDALKEKEIVFAS